MHFSPYRVNSRAQKKTTKQMLVSNSRAHRGLSGHVSGFVLDGVTYVTASVKSTAHLTQGNASEQLEVLLIAALKNGRSLDSITCW